VKAELEQAMEQMEETFAELQGLDVFVLEPAQALLLIPFACHNELAWFIFDSFEPEFLQGWRYQRDGLTITRPISELIPFASNEIVL
jgi:hypothetical protein